MNKTNEKAIMWIYEHTVGEDEGIIVTTKKPVYYPEVTGYYIPSLLNAGETELAKKFAISLCERQKKDGSWYNSDNDNPFIFDTCQILKGLVAIRRIMPEVDSNIERGIDWVFSNLKDDGHLIQPNTEEWGGDDTRCNDLIHIYCMSPIIEAGKLFNRPDYIEKANRVLYYYIANYHDRIVNYTLFSHFYAYVIIAEEFVKHCGDDLPDYKFLCFDGVPVYCWVDTGRYSNHKRNVYNLKWELQPWNQGRYGTTDYPLKAPDKFNKMIEIAAKLSAGFPHVRVDLYNVNGEIYFWEMTFTNGSGLEPIIPQEADEMLGNLWKLP